MSNTIIPPLAPQEPKINRAGVAQTQPPTTVLDLLARPMLVMPEEEDLNPLNATGYGEQVAPHTFSSWRDIRAPETTSGRSSPYRIT